MFGNVEEPHKAHLDLLYRSTSAQCGKLVLGFLDEHRSVQFVRMHWVDFSGVLRTRLITKERLLKVAVRKDSCGLAKNCMTTPVLPPPDYFALEHELCSLHPDWCSLRLCGDHTTHAMVMCFVKCNGEELPFS